ncbi:endonuclease [Longibacter salinarum]|uniref:Endonuclease n=1 Tax=Longibacter salinarum TaxID=1850348 RepID=A0A2A8D1W5_9BACT|nr:endonuclease/exonuclease/phosphatase family protein [Longibacter salinarum]PEN14638.1 endonuclease [Longibacter salinarum]
MQRLSLLVFVLSLIVVGVGCSSDDDTSSDRAETIRFMTYNIEDVRTGDVKRADHPRLERAAARIQTLRPDVLLVNELSYDQQGGPDVEDGDSPGQNAQRFVDQYLSQPRSDSLQPVRYQTVMLPVNTGISSGFDLNNDGEIVETVPEVPSTPPDGSVPPQNDAGRAYGGDTWGFGTFPGHYGMALFVREDLKVLTDSIRTFRLYPWSRLPGAEVPTDSVTGEPFYSSEEWEALRLSSKSHWDIPIELPNGDLIHVLASHPTPPTFDGAADRNGHRNHDEIRFWQEYISGADHIVDDSSKTGGLASDASFVIMGDQNADPDEGDTYGTPIADLLNHDRVQSIQPEATPAGQSAFPDLDADDTARWGLRVDYVIPSEDLNVVASGVWRPTGGEAKELEVSDHFPVWVDVSIPASTSSK